MTRSKFRDLLVCCMMLLLAWVLAVGFLSLLVGVE